MKPNWDCIYYSSVFLLRIFYCRCLRRLGVHRVDLHLLTFLNLRYLHFVPYCRLRTLTRNGRLLTIFTVMTKSRLLMFGDQISGPWTDPFLAVSLARSSTNASFSHNQLIIRVASSPPAPMVVPHENSLSLGPYTESSVPSKSSTLFPVFSPFVNAYSRLSSWRAALGLPNPGTVENLQKEVKSEFFAVCKSVRGVSQGDTATHLTNFIFDGARADLMKGLSMDPAFQVTHSFQLASQSAPPTYSFGALFANAKVGYRMPTCDLSYLFTVNPKGPSPR
jgi:hypothetical protein